MRSERDSGPNPLVQSLSSALLWGGSFTFALTWFLAGTKLFRGMPETPAVAIGRVTIDGVSKSRDYAAAALFFIAVPLLTILFRSLAQRLLDRLVIPIRRNESLVLGASALFSLPLLVAPFFFLTTRKELWGILMPPVLAAVAVLAFATYQTRLAVRRLFFPEFRPVHWLLLTEGFSWILFRWLATGKRIAHLPTLFLEVVFVAFFLLLFWAVAFLIANLMWFVTGRDRAETMTAVAFGATPLLVFPLIGLAPVSGGVVVAASIATLILVAIAVWRGVAVRPRAIWNWVAYIAAPLLIFCISYASTAELSQWVDLFHRGESLGPASDYLRGKVPYRDVFVLHGMLEDGLLDGWLMRMFGRTADVAMARLVILAALTMPLLWLISIIALDSIPLALLTVLFGYVISTGNQRSLSLLLVVIFLVLGLKRDQAIAVLIAGVFAALGVFYSLDIGLYGVIGALVALIIIAFVRARGFRWLLWFLGGLVLGAAPFIAYLATKNAIFEFFQTSFVSVPAVIDAVWSLPFPDLASAFRDMSVRTVADFVLSEKFRFILNPLVLGIASAYVVVRMVRMRKGSTARDAILLVLVLAAILTQRSALGRADFPHQYFSAFLLPPILAILAAALAERVRIFWRGSALGERALIVVAGAGVTVLLGALLWVPDLLSTRLDGITQYRSRIAGKVYDLPGLQSVDRITAVRTVVQQLTRPGEPVFDFSNQPALYFFTDRPNPTRFYQIPILSPVEFQMEAISDLAKARPKIVFRKSPEGFDVLDGITNDVRAAAVAAYLDDHYAFHRNVRGVELWQRIGGRGRSIEEYRRMFRLPTGRVGAPDQRVVFPAVAGIREGPSLWRSDLVIYNPHWDPIRLHLRYLTEERSFDRELTIEARNAIEMADFVWTFFKAAETRGVLWVSYPGDQRPLMRLTTYDTYRQGSSSVIHSLQPDIAATGLTLQNELTAAPLQMEGHHQLEVGVFNVGPGPARIRVSASDAANHESGRSAEVLILEGQHEILDDLQPALGVVPGQWTILKIQVLEGTVIGYGAVRDPAAGTITMLPAVPSHAR